MSQEAAVSTATTISNRLPRSLPLRAFDPSRHLPAIEFLHPGYRDDDSVLLSLPRVDECPSGWGVHHLTALTACQILAGNAWDGFLALDARGQQRVELGSDEALTNPRYWFIVPGDNNYAVVPSFQEWRFPHDDIPRTWFSPRGLTVPVNEHINDPPVPSTANDPQSDSVRYPGPPGALAGSRCVITNSLSTNCAHLIPKAEGSWYGRNKMHRFAVSTVYPDVDNVRNVVFLRDDLHKRLDERVFAFVPKRGQYVVHALLDMGSSDALPEFVAAYHNLPVQHIFEIPRQYLFARFAANIFMHAKYFLVFAAVPRKVLRYHVDEEEGDILEGPVTMKPSELRDTFGGGRSKSASPKKRSRSARSGGAAEQDWSDSDSVQEQINPFQRMRDLDSAWYEENVAPSLEEPRGRSMARRGYPSTQEDLQSRPNKRQRCDGSLPSTPSLTHTSFAADSDVTYDASLAEPVHGQEGQGKPANEEVEQEQTLVAVAP